MKQVEFYNWILPPDRLNKKPRKTRRKITAEDAARYPGAVPDLTTREVRELPETPSELAMSAVAPYSKKPDHK
jgi:hypothetical protein